jgi:hypothetical protein
MNKTVPVGLIMAGTLVAAGTLLSGASSTAAPRPAVVGHVAQSVDPAAFTSPRANPYFPLRPGRVTVLRGSDGPEHFRERVEVTHRTKVIQGVSTRVITDVLHRRNGTLAEKTTDWYAADNAGNVWYFGENTATYDAHGRLDSREGTWMAGRNGAVAGTIMPANPAPTDAYRQEFARGHAEDQAWIVNNIGQVTVPAGSYRRVVRTYEWSRLEPGVVSLKLYAPGVGIVKEQDVAGGHEKFVLASVRG